MLGSPAIPKAKGTNGGFLQPGRVDLRQSGMGRLSEYRFADRRMDTRLLTRLAIGWPWATALKETTP